VGSFALLAVIVSRCAIMAARTTGRMTGLKGDVLRTRYRGVPDVAVGLIARWLSAPNVAPCQSRAYFSRTRVRSGYVVAPRQAPNGSLIRQKPHRIVNATSYQGSALP
jgi:hypothetical protein